MKALSNTFCRTRLPPHWRKIQDNLSKSPIFWLPGWRWFIPQKTQYILNNTLQYSSKPHSSHLHVIFNFCHIQVTCRNGERGCGGSGFENDNSAWKIQLWRDLYYSIHWIAWVENKMSLFVCFIEVPSAERSIERFYFIVFKMKLSPVLLWNSILCI